MTAVEFLLTFSIGGLTLKGLIQWLKLKLKVEGLLAYLLTFAVCVAVSAVYVLVGGLFGLPTWEWNRLLVLAAEVYLGTQVVYQISEG
jgi:hypothetical protein